MSVWCGADMRHGAPHASPAQQPPPDGSSLPTGLELAVDATNSVPRTSTPNTNRLPWERAVGGDILGNDESVRAAFIKQ